MFRYLFAITLTLLASSAFALQPLSGARGYPNVSGTPCSSAGRFNCDSTGTGKLVRKSIADNLQAQIDTISNDSGISASFVHGNVHDTASAQGWSNTAGVRTLTLASLLTGAAANFSGAVLIGGGAIGSGDLVTIVDNQAAPVQMRVRNSSSDAAAYAMLGVNAFGNSWGMRMGSAAANGNALEFVVDAFGSPASKLSISTAGVVTIPGATSVGSITTGAPSGGSAGVWKTGIKVTAASVVDATQYIQLDVGGTLYKLVVAQ